jgi:hypothetical protein
MRQPPNQPASQRPLRARSGSVAWAPLPPVVSLGSLDRVQLSCTRRPLLHCPALPAGSTCNTALARCFAGLSLPHSRPGPPVVFIPLARCFAGFPLQHARPGPPVVFIPLARYFVALSPGPRPAYTCGTPVARCFTGLSPRPPPPPPPPPPRPARSGWTRDFTFWG